MASAPRNCRFNLRTCRCNQGSLASEPLLYAPAIPGFWSEVSGGSITRLSPEQLSVVDVRLGREYHLGDLGHFRAGRLLVTTHRARECTLVGLAQIAEPEGEHQRD